MDLVRMKLSPIVSEVKGKRIVLIDDSIVRGTTCGQIVNLLRSAGATCEEAAVLILDSEDAAQTTMTALDGYIQNQIDTNKDYRPEEIPKLESAWTSARANTVLLVVAEDVNAAMDAVKN